MLTHQDPISDAHPPRSHLGCSPTKILSQVLIHAGDFQIDAAVKPRQLATEEFDRWLSMQVGSQTTTVRITYHPMQQEGSHLPSQVGSHTVPCTRLDPTPNCTPAPIPPTHSHCRLCLRPSPIQSRLSFEAITTFSMPLFLYHAQSTSYVPLPWTA